MDKIDIYDLINRFNDISNALDSFALIAHYSDDQLKATDFAPFLTQLRLQLDRETKTLNSMAEGLK